MTDDPIRKLDPRVQSRTAQSGKITSEYRALQRYVPFCERDGTHDVGHEADTHGAWYDADDVDKRFAEMRESHSATMTEHAAALAAKDERIVELEASHLCPTKTALVHRAYHDQVVAAKDEEIARVRLSESAAFSRINDLNATIDHLDAELLKAREEIAEMKPLAEIGRLAVKKRKAQIHKDNTPAGDLREVLLRRADLLDADANLDDATGAYLTTHTKQDTEDE